MKYSAIDSHYYDFVGTRKRNNIISLVLFHCDMAGILKKYLNNKHSNLLLSNFRLQDASDIM